jgi:hypothetical protein
MSANWIGIVLALLLAPFVLVTGWRELRRWRGTGE